MNKKKTLGVGLVIFLSFLLTSATYMTWWLSALVPNFTSTAADLLSEGVGYLFQVIGLLLMAHLIRRESRILTHNRFFWFLIIFDYVAAILACAFSVASLILIFGFLMNFFHGIIAGWYLWLLAKMVDKRYTALTFGTFYALASLMYYLLSMATNRIESSSILFIIYFVIAVLTVIANDYCNLPSGGNEPALAEDDFPSISEGHKTSIYIHAVILIVLLSLTRGLGFYFPTSDVLLNGIDPILTRCFYAVGLILAGVVSDVSRRYGGILCGLSLIFPFIVLSLRSTPNLESLFWIIGYILFGFLAVYRVTLMIDLSKTRYDLIWLSVLGLAAGRLGDVTGVFLGVMCSNNIFMLLLTTVIFFIATTFVFFTLYNHYYVPTRLITKELPVLQTVDDERAAVQHFADAINLSGREVEVLSLLLEKKTNAEIAYELHITDNTVKFHVRNILKKADCENRKQLLAKAQQQ